MSEDSEISGMEHATDHPGPQAMAEEMSSAAAGPADTGAGTCSPYDMTNRGRASQAQAWRDRTEEDPARGTAATVLLDLERQRLARSAAGAICYPPLAPDDDLAARQWMSSARGRRPPPLADRAVRAGGGSRGRDTPRGRLICGRDDSLHLIW